MNLRETLTDKNKNQKTDEENFQNAWPKKQEQSLCSWASNCIFDVEQTYLVDLIISVSSGLTEWST